MPEREHRYSLSRGRGHIPRTGRPAGSNSAPSVDVFRADPRRWRDFARSLPTAQSRHRSDEIPRVRGLVGRRISRASRSRYASAEARVSRQRLLDCGYRTLRVRALCRRGWFRHDAICSPATVVRPDRESPGVPAHPHDAAHSRGRTSCVTRSDGAHAHVAHRPLYPAAPP